MYKFIFLAILLFISKITFSQGSCDTAVPFCNDFGSQDAVVNGSTAQVGPNYGCLETQPNPTWSVLRIKNAGDIALRISQVNTSGAGIDVDFICYGPFNDPITPCQNGQLTAANTIACGYTPNTVEFLTITNTQVGEYYLILITNFSEQSGLLSFEQTNVGGESDCSLVCTVTVPDDQTICINSDYTINTTLGHPNMIASAQYKWFKNNIEIIGETNDFLTVTSSTITAIPDLYRVEVIADNCDDIAMDEITLNFVDVFSNFKLTNISPINVCDDDNDGFFTFDLSVNEVEIANLENATDYNFLYYTDTALSNQITSNLAEYVNTIIDSQTIYVSITHKNFIGCNGVTSFDIFVNRTPVFDVSENQYICIDASTDSTFEVLNPLNVYTYSWTDDNDVELSTLDTFSTSISGDYHLTATSTNAFGFECSDTKTVSLFPVGPAIITNTVINEYWVEDNFDLSIEISGVGVYEYAFDNIDGPYQEEPYFVNISPGIYEIFVREINGCGISSKEIRIFGFPNFFSPNEDGINDIWKVQGINFKPSAKIYIFDRSGKLISHFLPAMGEGWDGLYRNKPAPETDYWFTAEMINYKGDPIIRKGHFSLIRTNN